MSQIRQLQERFELEERKRDSGTASGGINWKQRSVVVIPKLADVAMETKILNADQVHFVITLTKPVQTKIQAFAECRTLTF